MQLVMSFVVCLYFFNKSWFVLSVSEDDPNALLNMSLKALTRSVLPMGKMPCFLNLRHRQIDGKAKLLIPGIRSR